MTIVVGYTSKSGTWLGSDSRITAGGIVAGNSKKLFQLHENLSLGVAGCLRDINIIKHSFRPYAPDKFIIKSKDHAEEYIVNKFIPDLIEVLANNGRTSPMGDDDGPDVVSWQGSLIIAVGKHLFGLYNDFAVNDLGKFGAIGSGDAYAMGFISDMEKSGTPGDEIIRRAIISSSKFDTNCDNKVEILKIR